MVRGPMELPSSHGPVEDHCQTVTSGSGAVAAQAELKKVSKYSTLPPSVCFVPVAIESLGTVGPRTGAFLRDLGRRISSYTGDKRATEYLFQRLAVAVQRGNSLMLQACLPSPPLSSNPPT
uniref:Uncharacterized protein n=1 Tax=Amphimedon queenslandica TaxID=400682 RepID=A0A1X7SD70_AMPQE